MDFQKGLAVLIWIISEFLDRKRVHNSTYRYPSYCPPARGERFVHKSSDAKRNFDFLIKHKQERIYNLQNLLLDFNTEVNLDANGMKSLDEWLFKYGHHLLGDAVMSYYSLSNFDPPWKNDLAGLNVIFDMSLLCGEYIISNNKFAHWNLYISENYPGKPGDLGYGKACLFGIKKYGYTSPYFITQDIYRMCLAGKRRREKTIAYAHQWSERGDLYRHLEALADSNPEIQIPFSHKS